jgi:hypothetical protein
MKLMFKLVLTTSKWAHHTIDTLAQRFTNVCMEKLLKIIFVSRGVLASEIDYRP